MHPIWIVVSNVIGYLLAQFARYIARTRFWKRVEENAARLLADPAVPIDDPAKAAEQALADAQRSQLSAIERSIERGGNGFRH